MKTLIAVVALAAFCSLATAAPLRSDSALRKTTHAPNPVIEIPIDPELAAALNDEARGGIPGLRPEKLQTFAAPPRNAPLAAAAFSAGTLLAFAAVLIVGQRNLRPRNHRRRRVKRIVRTMAM